MLKDLCKELKRSTALTLALFLLLSCFSGVMQLSASAEENLPKVIGTPVLPFTPLDQKDISNAFYRTYDPNASRDYQTIELNGICYYYGFPSERDVFDPYKGEGVGGKDKIKEKATILNPYLGRLNLNNISLHLDDTESELSISSISNISYTYFDPELGISFSDNCEIDIVPDFSTVVVTPHLINQWHNLFPESSYKENQIFESMNSDQYEILLASLKRSKLTLTLSYNNGVTDTIDVKLVEDDFYDTKGAGSAHYFGTSITNGEGTAVITLPHSTQIDYKSFVELEDSVFYCTGKNVPTYNTDRGTSRRFYIDIHSEDDTILPMSIESYLARSSKPAELVQTRIGDELVYNTTQSVDFGEDSIIPIFDGKDYDGGYGYTNGGRHGSGNFTCPDFSHQDMMEFAYCVSSSFYQDPDNLFYPNNYWDLEDTGDCENQKSHSLYAPSIFIDGAEITELPVSFYEINKHLLHREFRNLGCNEFFENMYFNAYLIIGENSAYNPNAMSMIFDNNNEYTTIKDLYNNNKSEAKQYYEKNNIELLQELKNLRDTTNDSDLKAILNSTKVGIADSYYKSYYECEYRNYSLDDAIDRLSDYGISDIGSYLRVHWWLSSIQFTHSSLGEYNNNIENAYKTIYNKINTYSKELAKPKSFNYANNYLYTGSVFPFYDSDNYHKVSLSEYLEYYNRITIRNRSWLPTVQLWQWKWSITNHQFGGSISTYSYSDRASDDRSGSDYPFCGEFIDGYKTHDNSTELIMNTYDGVNVTIPKETIEKFSDSSAKGIPYNVVNQVQIASTNPSFADIGSYDDNGNWLNTGNLYYFDGEFMRSSLTATRDTTEYFSGSEFDSLNKPVLDKSGFMMQGNQGILRTTEYKWGELVFASRPDPVRYLDINYDNDEDSYVITWTKPIDEGFGVQSSDTPGREPSTRVDPYDVVYVETYTITIKDDEGNVIYTDVITRDPNNDDVKVIIPFGELPKNNNNYTVDVYCTNCLGDSDIREVTIGADVEIVMTPDKPVYRDTETVTYTETVTNTGDVPLTDVVVTQHLPGTYPEQDGVTPKEDGTTAAYIPDLEPGESFTFTYVVRVEDYIEYIKQDQPETMDNAARVNTAQKVTDDDQCTVEIIYPDISIIKEVDRHDYHIGDEVVWIDTVTNTGDYTLTNIVITETLDGTFIIDTDYDTTENTMIIPILEPGDSYTYKFVTVIDEENVSSDDIYPCEVTAEAAEGVSDDDAKDVPVVYESDTDTESDTESTSDVTDSEPESDSDSTSDVTDSEPDSDTESTSDVTDTEPESDSDSTSDVTDTEPESDTDSASDVTDSEPESDSDSTSDVTDSEPESDSDSTSDVTDTEPESDSDSTSDVTDTEPESDTDSETDNDTDSESDTDKDSDTESDTDSTSDTTDTETEIDTDSTSDTTDSETDNDTDSTSDTTDSEPDSDTDSVKDTKDSDSETDTGIISDSDTTSDVTDTEPDSDTDSVKDTKDSDSETDTGIISDSDTTSDVTDTEPDSDSDTTSDVTDTEPDSDTDSVKDAVDSDSETDTGFISDTDTVNDTTDSNTTDSEKKKDSDTDTNKPSNPSTPNTPNTPHTTPVQTIQTTEPMKTGDGRTFLTIGLLSVELAVVALMLKKRKENICKNTK